MRSYLVIALGSLVGFAAVAVSAAASLERATPSAVHLAQNTGAADRTLGNSSMGVGEGIERLPELPELPETANDRDEGQRSQETYEESGHGDNDTDMEHHPRRTLGDREDK
jgi:hypothetical protein